MDAAEIATPIGYGCRKEGPHGPTACNLPSENPDVQAGAECSCGCSAFEDCCETYLKWYDEEYR